MNTTPAWQTGDVVQADEAACRLCGAHQAKIVYDRGRDDTRLLTAVCQACGFVYVVPRPATPVVQEHYTSGAFARDGRGSTQIDRHHWERTSAIALRRYRELRDFFNGIPAGWSLVDVGSGTGAFLRVAQAAGLNVTGIEPDPAFAAESAARVGCDVHAGFAETVALPDHQFDLATSFHTIEHVDDPVEFLAVLRRRVQPQGVVWIECPGLDNVHTPHIDDFFWAPHINVFTRKTLCACAVTAGLDVLEAGAVPGGFIWLAARPADTPVDPRIYANNPARIERLIQRQARRTPGAEAPLGERLATLAHKVATRPHRLVPAARRWARQRTAPPAFRLAEPADRPHAFLHLGVHQPGNAGDTVLFPTLRALLDQLQGKQHYEQQELWPEFTSARAQKAAEKKQVLLLGGGGVLLPDTRPNPHSGWQWNCPLEVLESLQQPLALFAVGYNAFRGQTFNRELFDRHITRTVEQAVFVGLRNRGSIAQLQEHLPAGLHDRLVYQPCMTTLLRRLAHPYFVDEPHTEPGLLALNVAFDREDLRLGERRDHILAQVAAAVARANRGGWRVALVQHVPLDGLLEPYLDRAGARYETVNLFARPVWEVFDFYSRCAVVVGMRGHSQMIPFGLGVPIVSLVSHEKLRYFLQDIERPEWGIDLTAPGLADALDTALAALSDSTLADRRADIRTLQDTLWARTQTNVAALFDRLP